MKKICECPTEPIDYGRGWTVSEDFERWTCTRCGGEAPADQVVQMATTLIESIPACAAIYRGEKP